MKNEEIRLAHQILTQVVTTYISRCGRVHVNPHDKIVSSRLTDFTRSIPLMFFGSKVGENHQIFLEDVYSDN